MEWLKARTIGGLLLAGYLIITGIAMIIGGATIPAWFIGLLAIGAGVLIVIGA